MYQVGGFTKAKDNTNSTEIGPTTINMLYKMCPVATQAMGAQLLIKIVFHAAVVYCFTFISTPTNIPAKKACQTGIAIQKN